VLGGAVSGVVCECDENVAARFRGDAINRRN